jgi:transporter family-2 protein
MMVIFIAFLQGVMVSLSRSLNGKLGASRDAFTASLWNHLVGFIFLTSVLFVFSSPYLTDPILEGVPAWAYLGGVFGALYVILNSYIVVQLGVVQCTIFVISGQLLFATLLDLLRLGIAPSPLKIVGILILGVAIGLNANKHNINKLLSRPNKSALDS